MKSRKEVDLIRALRPLDEVAFIRGTVAVFFRESAGRVSAAIVREVRTRLRKVQLDCRNAEEAKQKALEQLRRIDVLLAQSPNNIRRVIKREQKSRRKEASISKQKWRDLSRQQKELEDRLKGLDAGFARQQILRFCKSKRYELAPLNLANAVAGLPYMGWRQSMRRSIKQPSLIANGLEYEVFKAIRFIASNAKRNSENIFVAEFRESVSRLPSRYRSSREELAKQWLFLERAIRRAFRSKPHPKAFTFEIAKHYFRQIRSRSQVDRILAQQAELRLSKQK